MLTAGEQAPDFRSLPAFAQPGGEGATLISSRPVLVAIFKISCPVCQFTFPFLERMYQTGSGALQLAAISQDDAIATAEFHSELGITLPTFIEPRGYLMSRAFGIDSVPSFFLVSEENRILESETGFSKDFLERMAEIAGCTEPVFRPGERIPNYRPG